MQSTFLIRVRRVWPALLIFALMVNGCARFNTLLRKQGIEAYQAEDLEVADEHFSQAIAQDPTDWKSLFYLGKIRLKQRRSLDAQLLLEKAFELRHHNSETPDILDAMAESLSRQGQAVPLTKLLERAVQDYGTSRDYARQGKYLQKLGDVDGAKLAYRKAAFFAPEGDVGPFLALADFYESISDTTNAVTALRHAYAVTPGDPRLNDRLRRYGIVPGPTTGIAPEKAKR